jgi:dipeptidyl aminopeptidase/acylaminoacyl peptidase
MHRGFGLLVVAFLAIGVPIATLAQGTLSITEQRLFDVDDVHPLSLSPDGRLLAVWNRAGEEPALCFHDAATLAEIRCAPIPRGGLAPDSVAWSPDGTHLAATEEALRFGEDGDIWVVDVEAGTATNLTDDGEEEQLRAAPGTPIDVSPAWSPDGTEIVFSRTVETGEEDEEGEDVESTALYRIPVTGGEPREVVNVADRHLVVYTGIRWLADDTILYSVDMYTDDPANGVWTVPADGGTPRQVVTAEAAGLERTLIADVSANGQALLISPGNVYALLDLATGQAAPVELPVTGKLPTAAAFSPDGATLLIGVFGDPDWQLIALDLATGEEDVVGALDDLVGVQDYRSGLTWATNDLVFAPGPGRRGLLVQLAA